MKSKVLVIIPAYNEATNLKRVVEDLSFHASFCDYLIINDGSTDNTVTLCEENHYHHLDLIANLGLFGAVQTGLNMLIFTTMILPFNLMEMDSIWLPISKIWLR